MHAAIGCSSRKVIRRSARQSETRRWADARETCSFLAISPCVRPAMKFSQPRRAATSRRHFPLSDATIKLLPIRSPEIRHSLEHAIGPRIAENGVAVARLIVAASDKSPNGHPGRLAGLYAANAVLDYEGAMRIYLHPFGGVEEEVGRRLAVLHHLRGIEAAVEMRRETGQREGERRPIDIAGRGDAMRDSQVLQYRIHPFDRAKRRKKGGVNPGLQFASKLLGDRASQRFVVFENRGQASSQEQIECLIDAKIDAVPCQRCRKAAAAQQLAVDQYAVAVENDEIGPDP